ncbi:MAG: NADH-quinone oxidoreductase subunit J [Pseudomonadota bacterium]
MQIFAFYLFATVLIASGALTIMSRNPVHSVLWLILAFFNAAWLMVIVGAEFIAMLLVIVYVGAVAVLFLFVVMMLDIDFARLRAGFTKNLPLGLALAVIFFAELTVGIGVWRAGSLTLDQNAINPAREGATNTQAVGELLYTKYPFLFEAAGVILLVAMVGAIVLTHRQRVGVRPQNVARQVGRRPEDAVRNTQPEVGKGVTL